MAQGAKILLVDDDPDIHISIGMMLRAEGYNVTSARDGVEAMKLIYKDRPDLVILDLLMPRKDGKRRALAQLRGCGQCDRPTELGHDAGLAGRVPSVV